MNAKRALPDSKTRSVGHVQEITRMCRNLLEYTELAILFNSSLASFILFLSLLSTTKMSPCGEERERGVS